MTDPTPTRRRFCPTPGWIILALLAVEGLLWLSERYRWFWFNERKGWTVLIAVAVVGVTMLVMLPWFIVALVFGWRFQFSIRSLLVLTVAVAIPCSWLAVEGQRAIKQRNLVVEVRKSACLVGRDWEFDSKVEYIRNAHLPEPEWLLNLLGEDFFDTVVIAELTTDATDATLGTVRGLTSLKELDLSGTQVTDAGLEQLRDLTELQHLSLWETKIGNTGLGYLKALAKLQELSLYKTQVTDVGLEYLLNLSQLKWLQPPDRVRLRSLG